VRSLGGAIGDGAQCTRRTETKRTRHQPECREHPLPDRTNESTPREQDSHNTNRRTATRPKREPEEREEGREEDGPNTDRTPRAREPDTAMHQELAPRRESRES
jgi:hypothetical protein